MSTVVLQETLRIPADVVSLGSFRRWVLSPQFPSRGRFAYFRGEVWVDMSPENLMTHNQVKGEIDGALGELAKASRLGRFFHDRTLVTNEAADLSTEPDGTFVSYESLRTGRVRLVEGEHGLVEVAGAPDMVLEVVSAGSVKKDTVVLRELYWKAGVREYWLVDARGETIRFSILRRGRAELTAGRTKSGWAESSVFGRSFRLEREEDELGYPMYTLRAK